MNNTNQNSEAPKCHDCGSELILIETSTYTLGNNLYPITKTKYRCSNDVCQEESDKRIAKKAELKKEQELARENRKKRLAALVSQEAEEEASLA